MQTPHFLIFRTSSRAVLSAYQEKREHQAEAGANLLIVFNNTIAAWGRIPRAIFRVR
jgi:hypothetical protein